MPTAVAQTSLAEGVFANLKANNIDRSPSPDTPFLLSSPSELDARVDSQTSSTVLDESASWSIQQSEELYCIKGWGQPYFGINPAGHLIVHPTGSSHQVDLYSLLLSLKEQGMQTPCLFRFPDIVNHRIQALQTCFDKAIKRYKYQGVFPVKCNHSHELLSSILSFGQPACGFGLEAGSKAELVLAMSMLARYPGANLVCNGYKDTAYMELALQCRLLGINAIIILEQASELDTLLRAAAKMKVTPVVGIRARLTTRHAGHWGSTSGDRAKFGLRPAEIVSVVEALAGKNMLDCLKLLHFHAGSQITNIRVVKEAMQEAAYMFAELVTMGAPMSYLDVGGGLAVDYDGSRSDTSNSLTYTMQQYANDVVATVQEVCTMRSIPMPTILSESGRALASHHTVMVFDVLTRPSEQQPDNLPDQRKIPPTARLQAPCRDPTNKPRKSHTTKGYFLLLTANEVLDSLEMLPSVSSLNEAYADASFFKEEALRAFKLGVLSLQERAEIDRLFDSVCERICFLGELHQIPLPKPLQSETRPHSSMYHVNLSVFRSAVDVWAVSQLFPIMPLHRLDEEPRESATLSDITCDSDGKFDRFISAEGGKTKLVLPLHKPLRGQPYLLGMFLGGVYQETMGSAHNMLGSTHAVHVKITPGTRPNAREYECLESGGVAAAPDGTFVGKDFTIDHIVKGQSIQEVLGQSQHQGVDMLGEIQAAADAAVKRKELSTTAAECIRRSFAQQLTSYTYLLQS